jgi:hypothetical protein
MNLEIQYKEPSVVIEKQYTDLKIVIKMTQMFIRISHLH